MAATVDPLDDVINNLETLKVGQEKEDKVEVGGKEEEKEDDGYNSSSSTENLAVVENKEKIKDDDDVKVKVEEKVKDEEEEKVKDEDEDDEKILEPLVILGEKSGGPEVEFISRGPVSIDTPDNRFQPYSRPDQHQGVIQSAGKPDEDKHQPIPNVLIYTKKDRERPSKIDVRIEWSDKHELCIQKYKLPEETCFTEGANTIQLFIQLNPNLKETKSFLADVKVVILKFKKGACPSHNGTLINNLENIGVSIIRV